LWQRGTAFDEDNLRYETIFKLLKINIMTNPKYTGRAVQNRSQDEDSDQFDSLNDDPITTGRNIAVEKEKRAKKITDKEKIKSYKEGIKDDNTLDENEEVPEEEDIDYGFDADEDEQDDSQFYGRGL